LVGLDGLREYRTLALAREKSLARFGDGELKLCQGEDSKTQVFNKKIAKELRAILNEGICHVAIPYVHPKSPRKKYWEKFLKGHSQHINPDREYGSAFVSRFDEAPWIDTDDYRRQLKSLWKGKNVTIAYGSGSLTPTMLKGAKSVNEVTAPWADAYEQIDSIEERIGHPELAVLCLGATATVLADRLARKGVHALDLGFVGKFL